MRVLVVQHDRFGSLGAYERVLTEWEAEIELVELDTGRHLPDWRAFDAILALGGHASIAAGSPPAWLAQERQYVRDAVMNGVPYWGVCFGPSSSRRVSALGFTAARSQKSGSTPFPSPRRGGATLSFEGLRMS
jgi:GMP synthase-like glutamine amidotransferase